MNLETLQSIVGTIDRGQLGEKFNPDTGSGSISREKRYLGPRAAVRVVPPLEDLSHLNPKGSTIAKARGKIGGNRSALKRLK